MTSQRFSDLRVGDPVPEDALPAHSAWPLTTALGPPRWHALTCRPQKEAVVEAWLARHGVTRAFHPVETRTVLQRGRVRSYARRYLPGYVFARFPGPVLRHRLALCPQLTGAVSTATGEWGCLKPLALRRIIAMRHVDEADRATRLEDRNRRRALARLAPGDRVLIASGIFEGREVEVAELRAGGVSFAIPMVGTSVLATLPLEAFAKVDP